MVLIYIRHSEDYVNSHEHDERLTKDGKKKAFRYGLELVEKYGMPNIIYHSPYFRARQTAKLIIKSIYKYHKIRIKRKIDPKLGRYFTSSEKENPDIKRSTKEKGAIIYENYDEFKDRVFKQLENREKEQLEDDINVWCISHNLVIRKIYKHKNIQTGRKYVKYLETFQIE